MAGEIPVQGESQCSAGREGTNKDATDEGLEELPRLELPQLAQLD